MSIVRAEILPVRGRLARPTASSTANWSERSSFLLELRDDAGNIGQGEASPLPGFSPDTLEECGAALERIRGRVRELTGEGSVRELLGTARALAGNRSPAALCALETALLDLVGKRRQEPAWRLLCDASARATAVPSLLPLAALLDASDFDGLATQARAALASGIHTLKLKIGRKGQLGRELEDARRLRHDVGAACRLRFDANRSLDAESAGAALEALAGLDAELLEEPTRELALLDATTVPLALDESLQEPHALEAVPKGVRAIVLKPMALGIGRCIELAERAAALGLDVVVTHLFDGPVALAAAASLALAVASPDRASGLARHAGLSAWPELAVPLISPAHVVRRDAPGLGLARVELRAA
jgi:L-Ala-D/L-Glu epimerase